MSWKRVLKVELRPSDIKHLGNKYALEDMYKSMLMTEEEYYKLPDLPPPERKGKGPRGPPDNKMAYHARLLSYIAMHKDSPFYDDVMKYWTFHNTMYRRLQKQKFGEGFLYESYPTLELFEASGTKNITSRSQEQTIQDEAYTKMFRVLTNLFEMKGIKTKEEVESIINRKLKGTEHKAYEDAKEKLA